MSVAIASKKTAGRATAVAKDYSQSQGGAAIGARLRRLSERVDADAEPGLFPIGRGF